MKIVGCDLHTRYQQVALLDRETGELIERRLEHESGEARVFYAALSGPVRVGIEATGHTRWFERMLAELGHEPHPDVQSRAHRSPQVMHGVKSISSLLTEANVSWPKSLPSLCLEPGRPSSHRWGTPYQRPILETWLKSAHYSPLSRQRSPASAE